MERKLARVTTTLIGFAVVVLIAWYAVHWRLSETPSADSGIPENVQQETSQALTIEIDVVSNRIDRLDTKSNLLQARIRTLDPIRAPSTKSLQSTELIERRELLDPGPSALELARRESRTPSGMSARALEAYTRETGIDPKRIEALMQRAQ